MSKTRSFATTSEVVSVSAPAFAPPVLNNPNCNALTLHPHGQGFATTIEHSQRSLFGTIATATAFVLERLTAAGHRVATPA